MKFPEGLVYLLLVLLIIYTNPLGFVLEYMK